MLFPSCRLLTLANPVLTKGVIMGIGEAAVRVPEGGFYGTSLAI